MKIKISEHKYLKVANYSRKNNDIFGARINSNK